MKKLLILLITTISLLFYSCEVLTSDFEKGKHQLEMQGYTNVKNTGYSLFCCDKNDDFSSGFEAVDKEGKVVKGCFCSGLLKGITIRFE